MQSAAPANLTKTKFARLPKWLLINKRNNTSKNEDKNTCLQITDLKKII